MSWVKGSQFVSRAHASSPSEVRNASAGGSSNVVPEEIGDGTQYFANMCFKHFSNWIGERVRRLWHLSSIVQVYLVRNGSFFVQQLSLGIRGIHREDLIKQIQSPPARLQRSLRGTTRVDALPVLGRVPDLPRTSLERWACVHFDRDVWVWESHGCGRVTRPPCEFLCSCAAAKSTSNRVIRPT